MSPQPESKILSDIRLALGKRGDVVVWRNSTGVADVEGRKQRFGLVKGGADLVGFVVVRAVRESRSDAVDALSRAMNVPMQATTACTFARFFALEVKTPKGRVSDEQRQFLDLVNRHGGYAAVARSVDDAVRAVEAAVRGDVITINKDVCNG